MAAGNATTPPAIDSSAVAAPMTTDEATAKAVHKRYEGLVMVRNKAIKGKGAWYWAHLEPLLVHNSDTGLPKAVKLKCCLCETMFSASNPSRTASEHLKRGTCPNFSSSTPRPCPADGVLPPTSIDSPSLSSPVPPPQHSNRKRASPSGSGGGSGGAASAGGGHVPVAHTSSFHVSPLSMIDPSGYCHEVGYPPVSLSTTSMALTVSGGSIFGHPQHPHLILSGGKEDLGALAKLEDSVKKLKSPKTSPGPALSKTQMDCALDYLADWVYESCGSVSFSSLEHPKFKAFLNQVGLPAVSRREFSGSRLDAKYEEARNEADARVRDAMFFQISSDGWKAEENLVNMTLNLPNGTSVFRRAVFPVDGHMPSEYVEDVLWESITDICGNSVPRCVGIVADKFKNKALRNLENKHHWMVNLSCQYRGFNNLIKDFYRELQLFKHVAGNCVKIANFVNEKSQVRENFRKFRLQECGDSGILRVPMREHESSNFEPFYEMIEDIMSSSRALQSVLLDESYKIASMEDPIAREFGEMIRDVGFWNELEAASSLIKLVKKMAREIETERPLVGQCLPLWDELRKKVGDWCSKFNISEGYVEKVIEKRFKKNYHPAWAAAYILDPLYLIRDSSGKYLPPFKCLTHQQEKDVDKLITRLVSREEAHIALMELMKWRTEGLDPVYAQAVQMKQRDPTTGKMRIANPQSSRLVWETYLTEFKSLGKVAVRLIFLHASSRGFKYNLPLLRWVQSLRHSREGVDRAQKMIFIAAQCKLERRDYSNDEDKDAELLATTNGIIGDIACEEYNIDTGIART